ncbi:hypothetical protein [Elizabethkingia meningoseptica]|uniref:hypothetical protein n=1 Tax=Elizabethkingia meningoseptica TaxID=238 RepID=UPI003892B95C
MIYNAKPGQTLAEICDGIRLENPNYLKDFHNKNCSFLDYIEGDISSTTRLSVPSTKQVEQMNQKIRENNESFYDFPSDGRFPFAYDLWDGIYHITQKTYLNDELLYNYGQTIQLKFEFKKDNCFYFQFSAFDFKKNDENSDNKISTLAKMCMKVIYPIRLIINSNGGIQKIELTKEPTQISSELEVIKQFFTDKHASEYIEKMKKIINDPKEISIKFGKTLIHSFLFGSFYGAKLNKWTSSQIYHDSYPYLQGAHSIHFELQNTLCPKETLDDEILKIKQKGICTDYRSLEELYSTNYDEQSNWNEKSIDCEHYAEYSFNRKNFSLQRIEAIFRNYAQESSDKEIFLLEKITDNT